MKTNYYEDYTAVIASPSVLHRYQVQLVVGHQSFMICDPMSLDEAQWFREMLALALERLVIRVLAKKRVKHASRAKVAKAGKKIFKRHAQLFKKLAKQEKL